MSHDIDEALKYLLDEEGGWVNNPNDRGGETKWGVTQSVYDKFRTLLKEPTRSVRQIEMPEARQLYDVLYWRAAGCDRLPWPISYLVFDASVNSGINRGIRWAQTGLGLTADSRVGPATVAAAQTAVEEGDTRKLVAIIQARSKFLTDLIRKSPSQLTFLGGWWNRTLKVLARSIVSMDE